MRSRLPMGSRSPEGLRYLRRTHLPMSLTDLGVTLRNVAQASSRRVVMLSPGRSLKIGVRPPRVLSSSRTV